MDLKMSTDRALELRLGLPGDSPAEPRQEKKRLFWEIADKGSRNDDLQTKNQVVGWPPVCSYRKRVIPSSKKEADPSKTFMKVSMDGAVYLRKIELGAQGGYRVLVKAIQTLFSCTGIGLAEDTEEDDSLEYMLIYEDKDGDWMLVGDVPWKMFLGSCKRLRVAKRSDYVKHMRLSTAHHHRLSVG
ncbi:hypothetical protein MLD38_030692 [Melastoma candidum]|uniref:Uncharacterized protein n=1 Tax=Melastoma candidum TaxID=119954 RepID=A0ACB9MPC5_9MYRT|nr:hypothetical protein MLD38_030692 [Melastoma candidum]